MVGRVDNASLPALSWERVGEAGVWIFKGGEFIQQGRVDMTTFF